MYALCQYDGFMLGHKKQDEEVEQEAGLDNSPLF